MMTRFRLFVLAIFAVLELVAASPSMMCFHSACDWKISSSRIFIGSAGLGPYSTIIRQQWNPLHAQRFTDKSFALPYDPSRKVLFSGIQPTGKLHIGNYFGSIQYSIRHQDKYDTFVSLADLHAWTNASAAFNWKNLVDETRLSFALLMACGLDHSKCTIFVQSQVPSHTQLHWLFSCLTSARRLEKMHQFEQKSSGEVATGNLPSLGLLSYPVLMSADILLYNTDYVAVGDDQLQHIELTRDIARKINNILRNERVNDVTQANTFLKIPEAVTSEFPSQKRFLSLLNGVEKMSKSHKNDMTRINLLDPPELVYKKILKSKTDSFDGLQYGNPLRPESTNMLNILSAVTQKTVQKVSTEFLNYNWSSFKRIVAEATVEFLTPIQRKFVELKEDMSKVDEAMRLGAEKAASISNSNLQMLHARVDTVS